MTMHNYLVVLPQDQVAAFNAALTAVAADYGGPALVPISSTRALLPIALWKRYAAAVPDAEARALLVDTGVEHVERVDDAWALAALSTRDAADLAPRDIDEPAPVVDAGNAYDWHLVESNLPAAWQLLGGRDAIDWGDLRVGQLDTGFTRHPCFDWNGGNSAILRLDLDHNFFPGDGAANPDTDFIIADEESAADPMRRGANPGHGTRTLGVLAGYDRSASARRYHGVAGSFAGFFGAAPRVPVVPVRINDSVFLDNVIATVVPRAIDYLVENAGVHVITLSMGAPHIPGPLNALRASPALRAALANAYARGVIVVCAAGNHIPNPDVVYPARLAQTIAVGGSTPGSLPWSHSSHGRAVDVCAPAWPIRRPDPRADGSFGYGWGDGTSFATPQVAGAAALWLVHRGDDIAQTYAQPWQRIAAFRRLLKDTAATPPGWDTQGYGAGILDAEALLAAPLPYPATLVAEAPGPDP